MPAGGLHVDGYFVKEGTVLGIPQYLVHRDQTVFTADAEHFRPERWLEADAASLRSMERNFMTVSIERCNINDIFTDGDKFGKGCRGCVGRELAMMEMRAFVVRVLTRLNVEWASSTRPSTANYWMMEYFDFHVKFTDAS